MSRSLNLRNALAAVAAAAVCYVVMFHGFDAVVENVLAQLRMPDAGYSTSLRPPRLIVPLI